MRSIFDYKTPLYSIRVRGKWGTDTCFQVRHGKQYIRSLSAYDLSAKAHLTPFQSKMAAAVAAWQALSTSEKGEWDECPEAVYKHLPGYNVFISRYLKS